MINFRILYLTSIIILSSIFVGCEEIKFGEDFLEKPVSTDLNIDTIYAHKVYAEEALAQVYHTLPDFLPSAGRMKWSMLESITDLADFVKNGGTNYHDGSINSSDPAGSVYQMMYNAETGEQSALYAFRAAHLFLNNIDRVPDMTAKEKNIRKGEAKLLIAFHYVQMFRYLGGMPWINKAYTASDDMKMQRLTVDEMVKNISNLIDEAVVELPWSTTAEDDGRMTKAAGLALKQRLLLFAASPLFNNVKPYKEGEAANNHYVWYGNYDANRWKLALDAGLDFLKSNQSNGDFYKLVSTGNPRMDFRNGYLERYNHEVLVAGRRFVKFDVNSNCFSQIKYGVCLPTINYVDMFQKKDGSEFDWNNPEDSAYPFFDAKGIPTRDPRLYETFIVNQDEMWGAKAQIYVGGKHGPVDKGSGQHWRWANEGYTGVGVRKLVLDQLNQVQNKFYQCPLLRLPEVYLNIAEAMNELGQATQTDEFGRTAYDYVNLVRVRVGMPGITPAKVASGVALREAILKERALEFGFEECRYFDIVRWKHKDYLETPLRRLVTTYDAKTKKYTHTISEGLVNKRVWVDKWDDKYYLNFIPLNEINKKYGLVQNPGWE